MVESDTVLTAMPTTDAGNSSAVRPTVRFEAKRNLPIIELPSFSSDATVASREHLSSDISDTSRPLADTPLE